MSIIAIANQKGCVAKTTSKHNLSVALAANGNQILLVDLDSQASLTISVCLDPLEMAFLSRFSREQFLDRALRPVRDEYGFILVDCPPQLSILTINALSFADIVLIPVKTDYLVYRGLTQLQDSIQEVAGADQSSSEGAGGFTERV